MMRNLKNTILISILFVMILTTQMTTATKKYEAINHNVKEQNQIQYNKKEKNNKRDSLISVRRPNQRIFSSLKCEKTTKRRHQLFCIGDICTEIEVLIPIVKCS